MEGDDHKEIEVGFLEGQNQWILFDKSDIRLQDISWDVIHTPKFLSFFLVFFFPVVFFFPKRMGPVCQ